MDKLELYHRGRMKGLCSRKVDDIIARAGTIEHALAEIEKRADEPGRVALDRMIRDGKERDDAEDEE